MLNPNYYVELETVGNDQMVKITVGSETLLLPLTEAAGLAEVISNFAELPGALDHIDNVFDDWVGS